MKRTHLIPVSADTPVEGRCNNTCTGMHEASLTLPPSKKNSVQPIGGDEEGLWKEACIATFVHVHLKSTHGGARQASNLWIAVSSVLALFSREH